MLFVSKCYCCLFVMRVAMFMLGCPLATPLDSAMQPRHKLCTNCVDFLPSLQLSSQVRCMHRNFQRTERLLNGWLSHIIPSL